MLSLKNMRPIKKEIKLYSNEKKFWQDTRWQAVKNRQAKKPHWQAVKDLQATNHRLASRKTKYNLASFLSIFFEIDVVGT